MTNFPKIEGPKCESIAENVTAEKKCNRLKTRKDIKQCHENIANFLKCEAEVHISHIGDTDADYAEQNNIFDQIESDKNANIKADTKDLKEEKVKESKKK